MRLGRFYYLPLYFNRNGGGNNITQQRKRTEDL